MKKFGDENNQTSEQAYSGLTITELEIKLITEEPESSRFKKVFLAVTRWGRLLIVLSLAVLLIYGACYIQNLKKEISELRRELNSRPGSISQAESTGLFQSSANTPPGGSELPPQNEFIIYNIQSGDNLSTISSVYYGNEEFAPYLAVLNNIPADSQLNVGQEIKVPEKPYDSWTTEER